MIIGLTGSMAAGKSTVAGLLKEYGFYVIDADRTAHRALELPAVKAALAGEFGAEIIGEDGCIDRKALSEKAFSAPEKTKRLNAIVHPAVIEAMLKTAEEASAEGAKVVLDVPLLFESGMDRHCDKVLVVAADDETRYLRIMLRDGLTREQAKRRIEKQMPQEEKIALADAVIFNDSTLSELRQNTEKALERIGIFIDKISENAEGGDER